MYHYKSIDNYRQICLSLYVVVLSIMKYGDEYRRIQVVMMLNVTKKHLSVRGRRSDGLVTKLATTPHRRNSNTFFPSVRLATVLDGLVTDFYEPKFPIFSDGHR